MSIFTLLQVTIKSLDNAWSYNLIEQQDMMMMMMMMMILQDMLEANA